MLLETERARRKLRVVAPLVIVPYVLLAQGRSWMDAHVCATRSSDSSRN